MTLSDISFEISSLDFGSVRRVLMEMEAQGVKGVWLTENNFKDAFVEIAALFSSTKRVRFGTMVAGIFSRSPMIAALSSISLSNLSQGRFVLGLGAQTKNSAEYWYGRSFEKPITQMSEFVQICRFLFQGSKVTYNGRFHKVRDLQLAPPRYPVKIFIAAINPKMIQLAGELADGVLGTFWTPKYIREQVLPNLKAGAERGGRDMKDFEILSSVDCFLGKDSEAVKPHLISVAMVPLFTSIFREMGYERELKLIRDAISRQDVVRAKSVITSEMIGDLDMTGDGGDISNKIDSLRKAGLTEVIVNPYVGNLFYEHYPDQFSFDISKYNGTPVHDPAEETLSLIRALK